MTNKLEELHCIDCDNHAGEPHTDQCVANGYAVPDAYYRRRAVVSDPPGREIKDIVTVGETVTYDPGADAYCEYPDCWICTAHRAVGRRAMYPDLHLDPSIPATKEEYCPTCDHMLPAQAPSKFVDALKTLTSKEVSEPFTRYASEWDEYCKNDDCGMILPPPGVTPALDECKCDVPADECKCDYSDRPGEQEHPFHHGLWVDPAFLRGAGVQTSPPGSKSTPRVRYDPLDFLRSVWQHVHWLYLAVPTAWYVFKKRHIVDDDWSEQSCSIVNQGGKVTIDGETVTIDMSDINLWSTEPLNTWEIIDDDKEVVNPADMY